MKPVIYKLWLSRNKAYKKGFSAGVLKKKIYNGFCSKCKKEFRIRNLHLEHTLPVMVGGLIFDKKNLTLMCVRCHNKKTVLDIKCINILKKMGVISSHTYTVDFYLHPHRVQEIFYYVRNIIIAATPSYEAWNGWDTEYELIMWEKNRKTWESENNEKT